MASLLIYVKNELYPFLHSRNFPSSCRRDGDTRPVGHFSPRRQFSEASTTMLACRRVGWRPRQASLGGKTWVGKQAEFVQKQSSPQPTRITCRTRSITAGAGLQVEQRSLARSSIDTLSKRNHACCWARSSTLRGSARGDKLRIPTNDNVMSRRAGLSSKATATTPLSNPSIWQIGVRFTKWRAPRMSGKAKGGGVAAGGSKRKISFLSGGGGSGDTALVYGLVAVSCR